MSDDRKTRIRNTGRRNEVLPSGGPGIRAGYYRTTPFGELQVEALLPRIGTLTGIQEKASSAEGWIEDGRKIPPWRVLVPPCSSDLDREVCLTEKNIKRKVIHRYFHCNRLSLQVGMHENYHSTCYISPAFTLFRIVLSFLTLQSAFSSS